MSEDIDIKEVGQKIGLCYDYVKTLLTKEELECFNEYCTRQETIGPMFNPSAFMGNAFEQIRQARNRADCLMTIVTEGQEED